jgi:hypothetical protein
VFPDVQGRCGIDYVTVIEEDADSAGSRYDLAWAVLEEVAG